jgi:two-component system, NarL family, nitrate/nitrite response regulator NarL
MTTVLVVSAVRLFRDGLAEILSRQSAIDVVGTSATTEEASEILEHASPSVLLLDVPTTDGPEVIRAIARIADGVKVVVLGIVESEAEVIAWAEAGVAGYVSRDASGADLTQVIEAVARGETLFPPRIAALLLRRVSALATTRPSLESSEPTGGLTTRERDIVELIDQGLSNKEIASQLCIEVSTVKNHVHNILDKLHVHRRSQAAALMRAASRTK